MAIKNSVDTPEAVAAVAEARTIDEKTEAAAAMPQERITVLEDGDIPTNWPARKKWSATLIIVFMTATITFCSSIHTAAIGGVAITFSCSRTVATLGVTTFLIGFATGPLLFAPLSEVWGRQIVFRITLFLFFCFNLGCALAPTIEGLLILRFLCGFFGSPVVTNSGGCLADIWPQSQRSVPFALFTTGSSLGPVIAPIVGGFISEIWGSIRPGGGKSLQIPLGYAWPKA
ncbi:hypothetical protein E8E14_014446 [Neopestalotiopsis sp. 37M]|nr:hypothetical protein E8E14_014446 [Neopestalotiopsis sp. 37M]